MKRLLNVIDNAHLGFIRPHYSCLDFTPSQNQFELLRKLEKNRFIIIKKARQVGFTTMVAVYIAQKMIIDDDFNVAIVTPNSDQSKEVLLKIKTFIKLLNNKLKFHAKSVNLLKLFNGSSVKACSSNSDCLKGSRLDMVYFDEFAHIRNSDDLFHYSIAALEIDGRIVIGSTPNGMNTFYNLYQNAIENSSDFIVHDMPIDSNPLIQLGDTENFAREFGMTEDMVNQEIFGRFIERPR